MQPGRPLHFIAGITVVIQEDFFARHGATFARSTSLFRKNKNTCTALYNFTVSDFLAGIVDITGFSTV